ncbi:CoB--CoM heterodisulfide reductase iron-sulfur subunit B family protein [uncultured Pseudodesulfovibrio sp.]|uniref:CoB--CoM heterodisulfide reductase iron-sulfur subunit B family protein n=1 Tax=uncultured Pseudodesulfovibrio sp. TaxID=2035858 RepID=UPI0029C7D609|nr:CoB--CoM heterodisulfide reductase iron-sulfur subunit B family protein [uncultured Pseudodesulfovibrio sp.]
MRYAYFPGCKIPHHLPQYGDSVRAVCRSLDVELVDIEFNCCGYPVRHESELASVFSAACNFALAERAGVPIMTPCKCCFGNLKYAASRLHENAYLAGEVEGLLAREGLAMPQRFEVRHLLTVLDSDVGAETLAERATLPLYGVKVACHYGCHALRPGKVTGFDDPLAPTVFERVVTALGAQTVDWALRLECCGHPLRGRDDVISESLMRRKLESANDAGAHVLATACTYCQMQFDVERDRHPFNSPWRTMPPAVLVSQLVGAALGFEEARLGLSRNRIPWAKSVLSKDVS